MKTILIAGTNGLLGQKLFQIFNEKFQIIATGMEDRFYPNPNNGKYRQFDITDATQCKELFSELKPEVVINAASVTNVDACETEKEECWNVNVKGLENLAKAAKRNMTKLIHVSTDYVFDGEDGPYSEEDRPNPLGYYGKSKLASENVCRMVGIPFAIIRTSVLYGLGVDVKSNFFLWLNDSLKQHKEVNIVTDQFNTPTLVDDLASGILQLIEKSAYGLFNLSGREYVNRYDFAASLADVFGYDKSLIHPITTDQLKQNAERPMKGGLKIDKAVDEIDYQPRSLVDSFEYLKAQLQTGKQSNG